MPGIRRNGMTVSVGDRVSLAARATGIVPVRQPGPAIGHAHVDPPHRDVLGCMAVYHFGLAAAYPITWSNTDTGIMSDILALMTSICIW